MVYPHKIGRNNACMYTRWINIQLHIHTYMLISAHVEKASNKRIDEMLIEMQLKMNKSVGWMWDFCFLKRSLKLNILIWVILFLSGVIWHQLRGSHQSWLPPTIYPTNDIHCGTEGKPFKLVDNDLLIIPLKTFDYHITYGLVRKNFFTWSQGKRVNCK